MEINVKREPSTDKATIGELSINGVHECYTLEDVVREVEGEPVEKWKIKGKTAIPRGRYEVLMTYSPKFGRVMPQITGVPGFDGIRIHPGNTDADTEGCLLVGTSRGEDAIYNSRLAFVALDTKLAAFIAKGEQVFITIS